MFYIMYIVFPFMFGKIFTSIANPNVNIINAGLSSYGGLIGVIFAAYVFEKIIYLKGKLIKASILSLPLVYSLSKMACFFAGCCSGIQYDGPFAIIYPFEKNIYQFPIQAVEVIVFLIIFIICYRFWDKQYISYITILVASCAKFLLEYLRYDSDLYSLSKNQIFSIILQIICILLWIRRKFKKRKEVKVYEE